MKLSNNDIQDIAKLLEAGKPLPEKYRFQLFGDSRQVELVWNGKTNEVSNVVLPFQTIEHVDEPRAEKAMAASPSFFDSQTGRQMAGWSNKLIWGDNKLILSSLKNGPLRGLIEREGGLKLIYIDPPFDVGADFSFNVEVGEENPESFVKKPSALEEMAYRDTWGRGADSFIAMIYERLSLMRDLLADDGSIYVHCDYRVNSFIRLALDEVFGKDNFRNEITWRRQVVRGMKSHAEYMPFNSDYIYLYSKDKTAVWNPIEKIKFISLDEAEKKYKKDDKGYFSTSDKGTSSDESIIRLHEEGRIYVTKGEKLLIKNGKVSTAKGTIRVKYYREQIGKKVKEVSVVDNIWDDIAGMGVVSGEHIGYPTQKPEKLLERIIKASSNEGDLIADFFSGSGTLAAVAEKNNRKWICSDLGKFAIHTTRKRMINVQRELKVGDKPYRAFEILNLGKYEREHFIGINKGLHPEEQKKQQAAKEKDYVALIIRAYACEAVEGFRTFEAKKSDRMVAIGPVNLAVNRLFVEEVLKECKEKNISRADILGFEFEMGLCPKIQEDARTRGVHLAMKYIPRDVFDKRAIEKNQVVFHDVAYIEVKPIVKKGSVAVCLTDFSVFYSQDSIQKADETLKKGKSKIVVEMGQVIKITKDKEGIMEREQITQSWRDWIDYWSVDFDFESKKETIQQLNPDSGKYEEVWTGDYVFENEWQTFRTKKNRKLEEESVAKVCAPGRYKIAVKVVDIFGNDTMKVIEVKV